MEEEKVCKEWYYTALKSIGDAVITTDNKGRITFMNKVSEDLTKWKQKDALGKQLSTVFNIVNEITGKKAESPIKRVLKEGKIVGLANHTALIDKKGKQISIEDSGAPIRDEKGKIVGAVMVFHDVVEKRRAEKALKESEVKFRDISLSTADWIWEVDKKGRYTYVSEKVKPILGYSPKEILGKTPFDLMLPEEAEKISKVFTKIIAKKENIVDLENWNLTKKGERICLLTNGVPLLDDKGDLRGYRGVDKDITASKEVEKQLRDEKIRTERYLNIAGAMIIVLENDGKILLMNKMAYKVLGYKEGELDKKNWFNCCLPKKIVSEIKKVHKKIIKGELKPVKEYENPVLTKNGEIRLVKWTNTFLKDKKGEIIGSLSSGIDITEQRKAEDSLEELKDNYQILANNVSDGIFIHQNEFFLEVNETLAKMMGYEIKEMIGKNISDFVTLDSVDKGKKHKKIVNTSHEYTAIRKDGSKFPIEVVANYTEYKGKKSRIVTVRDITERKKGEEKLKEQLELIKAITKDAKDAIFAKDLDRKYTFVNPVAAKMIGDKPGNILGKTAEQVFSKKDAQTVKEVDNLCFKGESVDQVREMNISGKKIYLRTTQGPLYGEGKKIEGVVGVVRDETAERELKEQIEQYKFVVEQSTHEIAFADLKGKIVFVNDAWAKNHGYKKDELIGKHLSMFHPKEELANVAEFNKELVKNGKYSGEIFHKRKDGSTYPTFMNNFVLKLEGKPTFLVGMATDITNRKKSEDRLKESEQKYRTLVEAANDVIIFIDKKGMVLEVNKKLTDISGYKKEEIVGKRISVLRHILPKESMVIILKNFARRLGGAQIGTYVVKIKTKKGELRNFEISAQVIEEKGEAIGNLAILRDVTERMRAEEEIIESQEELEAVVENIGDGVFVLDNDRKIVTFNKEAEIISGWKRSEVMNKKFDRFLKFVFEGTDKSSCGFVDSCFKSGKAEKFTNHAELIIKNGERVSIGQSVSPLKSKEGKITGCVVVFRDISKEREIDKMKTEFVSVASHQLRTPLSGVKWITELLLRGKAGKLSLKQEEYVRDIYSSNDRLISLVGDLLDVSHIETGRKFNIVKRKTSTCKIIDEVVQDKKERFKQKDIKLVKKYTEGAKCLMVSADGDKIKQVFANLLDNAIKFTPDKGNIRIGCKANKNEIVFQIKDDGVGIPKRQQQRVFEKFFRADNVSTLDVGGTGLGLYIAKAIVEAHQGEIWFESKENKGTTFYVSIPLSNKINKK